MEYYEFDDMAIIKVLNCDMRNTKITFKFDRTKKNKDILRDLFIHDTKMIKQRHVVGTNTSLALCMWPRKSDPGS